MEILTVLLMGYTIGRNLVTLEVINENRKRQHLKFSTGKYSSRDLNAYKNKNIEIGFEWGNEGQRKLISVSLPSPTIDLDIFKKT